jgi:CheY-like chemotaxis protein
MADFAPHVVICDVCMPGEDGYTLIRRIRELPVDRGGRVAAAALTGFARSEDRARSLAAGFDLHLTKPFDATKLILALSSLADASRA